MAIAFPFIEVAIDTSALMPEVQRAPGVLAIAGVGAGAAAAGVPHVVDDAAHAATLFGATSNLAKGLAAAFSQDPGPSKVYGVKLASNDAAGWTGALTALEAADDVTFIALAGAPVGGADNNAAAVAALLSHCELQSAAGNKRIGVAHVGTDIARTNSYVADVKALVDPVKSSAARLVMIAARGAVLPAGGAAEVSCAAAGAIAGLPVASSVVLKQIRGFRMPLSGQYGAGEIKGLAGEEVIAIVDPALIPGDSLHFAEGTAFSSHPSLLYIDTVRLLDDVEFRLKAGIVGVIGDARITRGGLADIIRRAEGILGVVQSEGGIDGYSVHIPVHAALSQPEAARTATQVTMINTARAQRLVDMVVSIVIGPAIHRLMIALQPRF